MKDVMLLIKGCYVANYILKQTGQLSYASLKMKTTVSSKQLNQTVVNI